jgi:hypothetical protein
MSTQRHYIRTIHTPYTAKLASSSSSATAYEGACNSSSHSNVFVTKACHSGEGYSESRNRGASRTYNYVKGCHRQKSHPCITWPSPRTSHLTTSQSFQITPFHSLPDNGSREVESRLVARILLYRIHSGGKMMQQRSTTREAPGKYIKSRLSSVFNGTTRQQNIHSH